MAQQEKFNASASIAAEMAAEEQKIAAANEKRQAARQFMDQNAAGITEKEKDVLKGLMLTSCFLFLKEQRDILPTLLSSPKAIDCAVMIMEAFEAETTARRMVFFLESEKTGITGNKDFIAEFNTRWLDPIHWMQQTQEALIYKKTTGKLPEGYLPVVVETLMEKEPEGTRCFKIPESLQIGNLSLFAAEIADFERLYLLHAVDYSDKKIEKDMAEIIEAAKLEDPHRTNIARRLANVRGQMRADEFEILASALTNSLILTPVMKGWIKNTLTSPAALDIGLDIVTSNAKISALGHQMAVLNRLWLYDVVMETAKFKNEWYKAAFISEQSLLKPGQEISSINFNIYLADEAPMKVEDRPLDNAIQKMKIFDGKFLPSLNGSGGLLQLQSWKEAEAALAAKKMALPEKADVKSFTPAFQSAKSVF